MIVENNLFDSHMYKEVIRQYDEVSDLINLDSNIRERLKLLERSGIKANFICLDHNDRCDCHRIYDEAA